MYKVIDVYHRCRTFHPHFGFGHSENHPMICYNFISHNISLNLMSFPKYFWQTQTKTKMYPAVEVAAIEVSAAVLMSEYRLFPSF